MHVISFCYPKCYSYDSSNNNKIARGSTWVWSENKAAIAENDR